MKKEDVLSKCCVKEVALKGLMFDNGQLVVPAMYNFVARAKKNLFVGTFGVVNGFRTYGIEATFSEVYRPYGEFFNEQLESKTLNTEVRFYTIDGEIHMKEKILACVACLNDDMIILLKSDYTWSVALIDYENLTITDIEELSNLEYLKDDYTNRRIVICKDGKYSVVTFDRLSRISSMHDIEYAEIVEMTEMGVIIRKNGKYGFVFNSGKRTDCIYDRLNFGDVYLIAVVEEVSSSYYSYKGELVCTENYHSD